MLRLIQYWARFYSFFLFRKGATQQAVHFWKHLQTTVALSRKLFRAGKPLNFIKAAAAAFANKTNDPILRITAFLRAILYAIYFTTDTITWINSSKVLQITQAPTLAKIGTRCWLLGMIANIFNSLRRHQIASAKEAALLADSDEKDVTSLKKVLAEKKAANLQLLWDVLDTTIPISSLGLANLDDGFVGLAGFITSALGARQQWAATS